MAQPRHGCIWPLARLVPAAYLVLAIYMWIDFTRIAHDGLANVGLFAVTLPATVIMLIVGGMLGRTAMMLPSGYGYLADTVLYYVPAVALTAALLWWVARAIDRRLG